MASRAVTGSLPRAEVRALAALTDGATRWVDRFHQGTWTDCLTLIRKEGAHALLTHVRTLERTTPPRPGKTHDDATVIYTELPHTT
ncbi:hypothetical protein SHKM778_16300 [Streptomyces sp. KM77-8]|uniref:Uncharacterized protein n=1 Tax=Streptomyces haneummycinicus TaxID=3074435 RepID=A0AAT9HCU9_9ACTN